MGGGITITTGNVNFGDRQIHGVAAGTDPNDAVNVSQLNTLSNTVSGGWIAGGDKGSTFNVSPGDLVKFTSEDKNIDITSAGNSLTFNLAKDINVGSITAGDTLGTQITLGSNGIDFSNAGVTNVTIKNPSTGVLDFGGATLNGVTTDPHTGSSVVNVDYLKNYVSNNPQYAGLNVGDGNGNSGLIAPSDVLKVVSGNTYTSVVYDAKSKSFVVSATGGAGGAWNVTDGSGTVNVPIDNNGNVAFKAGSDNVVVTPTKTPDGAQVVVDIAKDLNLNSVTTKNADGSGTVLNGGGVTFIDNKGNKTGPSMTQEGIDAGNQKITNVAAGTNPNDAVNVSQLNKVGAGLNQLNKRIDDVEKNADAGTATALAVAGLPQAYMPGKSMVSMSGGVYRGESGYAVGYSSISEGGNWVVKAAASGNSQGYFGGTAGVGYQW